MSAESRQTLNTNLWLTSSFLLQYGPLGKNGHTALEEISLHPLPPCVDTTIVRVFCLAAPYTHNKVEESACHKIDRSDCPPQKRTLIPRNATAFMFLILSPTFSP